MVLADCESELVRDGSRGLEGGAFFAATLLNRKEAQTSKGKHSMDALKDFYALKSDARFIQYFLHKFDLDPQKDNTPNLMVIWWERSLTVDWVVDMEHNWTVWGWVGSRGTYYWWSGSVGRQRWGVSRFRSLKLGPFTGAQPRSWGIRLSQTLLTSPQTWGGEIWDKFGEIRRNSLNQNWIRKSLDILSLLLFV